MMDKWKCEVCGIVVDDFEPEYCCPGRMEDACGCMGLPIEPCLCSKECTQKLYGMKITIKEGDG